MILYLLALVSSFILFWIYKIISDEDQGFTYLLLCPKTRTVDGTKLSDAVRISKPGTIFRNTFDFVNFNAEKLFNYSRGFANEYKCSYLLHFLVATSYNVIRAEDLEDVMKEPDLITKGVYYHFLEDFLGSGLLTSAGNKWHNRRKLLTPSFHFTILERFIDIFRSESGKFVKDLVPLAGEQLVLQEVIPKTTLNIICESALGIKLSEVDSADFYRKTIKKIEHLEMERSGNFLMYFDFIYNWFGTKTELVKECSKAHTFTSEIINKRREGFQGGDGGVGRKKRFALLDNLLIHEKEGLIDGQGVCEEVDTLTFEGFDTTSTGVMFTIFMLGQHQDIQQLAFEEVKSVVNENMTVSNYSNLQYLERVIKESLRLYPPVPYVSREVVKESKVGNLILGPKSDISIHIFDIHRDPKYYPDPERFDPDRFLPINTENRHPFAYIPFSAGLRNCIGQKFAMLELKSIVAAVLKNYKILPVTKREDLRFEAGLILRPSIDLVIKLEKRAD
ncbi:hypothetical protein ACFFRR_006135 [Megaselia abdita]